MTAVVDLERAVSLLAGGEVVALPTDTVYGVGAVLAIPSAVATLFTLKRRPGSLALPVLVDSIEQIESLGVAWPEKARRLARAFWPGALTIVVPVPRAIATLVGGASSSAGFRIPNDAELRTVLSRVGAVALTSANEHGDSPCQSAAQVLSTFAGRGELAGVVDGGERVEKVSTVIELTESSWRIIREGAISVTDITAVLDHDWG
jgi:tRNA threonylcarbamoyl adenosine modification protein (Sua5/YciO/YrdC/YwlC family)